MFMPFLLRPRDFINHSRKQWKLERMLFHVRPKLSSAPEPL